MQECLTYFVGHFFSFDKSIQISSKDIYITTAKMVLEALERIRFKMEVTYIPKHRLILVRVTGEIDHHSAESIRRVTEKEIRRTSAINIAFDFGSVTFMDSSGIGMIIGRYKTASSLGGSVIVFDANEQVMRLMDMSGLSRLVIISDTMQKGITAMKKLRGVNV